MDNKFSKMDISKFDPTNASVDSVRKWLFAIIDAELDKDLEERDYDLIEECSECERELPTEGAGMSEKELAVGLERIKAQVSETEDKEIKIIKTKKKSKKSVRVIVILAAVISTMLLSVTVAAISQGKSVGEFISENIQKIFNMDAGEKISNDEITLIKNGEFYSYSSLEDALKSVDENILYPSYLPNSVKIERIFIVKSDDGSISISFITNDDNISIRMTTNVTSISDLEKNSNLYKSSNIDFYLFEEDGIYQSTGLLKNVRYSIKYTDYDEMLNIMDGFKEIKK